MILPSFVTEAKTRIFGTSNYPLLLHRHRRMNSALERLLNTISPMGYEIPGLLHPPGPMGPKYETHDLSLRKYISPPDDPMILPTFVTEAKTRIFGTSN